MSPFQMDGPEPNISSISTNRHMDYEDDSIKRAFDQGVVNSTYNDSRELFSEVWGVPVDAGRTLQKFLDRKLELGRDYGTIRFERILLFLFSKAAAECFQLWLLCQDEERVNQIHPIGYREVLGQEVAPQPQSTVNVPIKMNKRSLTIPELIEAFKEFVKLKKCDSIDAYVQKCLNETPMEATEITNRSKIKFSKTFHALCIRGVIRYFELLQEGQTTYFSKRVKETLAIGKTDLPNLLEALLTNTQFFFKYIYPQFQEVKWKVRPNFTVFRPFIRVLEQLQATFHKKIGQKTSDVSDDESEPSFHSSDCLSAPPSPVSTEEPALDDAQ